MDAAELARIAARYDTAMSRAMLKACAALGAAVGEAARRPCRTGAVRTHRTRTRRYAGMMKCMRNTHSPMDW